MTSSAPPDNPFIRSWAASESEAGRDVARVSDVDVDAWNLLDAEPEDGAPPPLLDGASTHAEPLGAFADSWSAPNPFVVSRADPRGHIQAATSLPEAELAQALAQADADTRRRAAAQREARAIATRRARLSDQAVERPASPAAWTLAPDGTCPLLGPVARWLREQGQAVAVPLAARSRAEFVERLDVLVRLADDIAARAQAMADDATADYAALDARAARCLSLAVDVRQAAWRARLECEMPRLMQAAADAARLNISQLETFCAPC